jgi:hypothetical protein
MVRAVSYIAATVTVGIPMGRLQHVPPNPPAQASPSDVGSVGIVGIMLVRYGLVKHGLLAICGK